MQTEFQDRAWGQCLDMGLAAIGEQRRNILDGSWRCTTAVPESARDQGSK